MLLLQAIIYDVNPQTGAILRLFFDAYLFTYVCYNHHYPTLTGGKYA
ncbi:MULTISPECIES: hypothetical protein [Paenibacillus]|nr:MULTISPECIES: hypothetical protein [Paenibacillus]